jgi:hypothetical protein
VCGLENGERSRDLHRGNPRNFSEFVAAALTLMRKRIVAR